MNEILKKYRKKNFKSSIANTSGFTLIELAIVTIISGILFIPLFQMYSNYHKHLLIEKTRDNVQTAQSLVSSLLDRYPCPADPTLPPSDPNYGKEQCAPAGNCASNPTGVCFTNGARTPAETVLIGAVPIRDIKGNASGLLTDDVALDAWGNKLLYAVTRSQTNGTTYSSDKGQIDAVNEFNNPPITHSPTAGFNKDASFVVLSHGPDGNGAYNELGTHISTCGTTRKEDENCNNDATFMSALAFYEGDPASYFDDIVYFSSKTDNSLWDNVISTAGVITGDIYNKNKNNVGIKQPTPTVKLDVGGTNGKIISAGNTKAVKICDYNQPTKCFDIKSISGAGMACPAGKIMQGITTNGLGATIPDCVTLVPNAPIDKDCQASGKWVSGLMSDGHVICSP